MTTEYSDIQKAEGKIVLVLQRLAEKYPFHVKVLEQFKLGVRVDVGTMGVMVAGNAVALLFNPAFVLATPAPELGGVLLHEVHHVVLKHILTDPADLPDEWARTVAQEVTVNEFVNEPLPAGVIVLADYANLPPLESTRQRYDRLTSVTRRSPITSSDAMEQTGKSDESCAGTPVSHDARQPQKPAKTKAKVDQHQQNAAPHPATTLDDHSVWKEGNPDRRQAEAVIHDVVEQAILAVGSDQVPPELQSAVAALGVDLEASGEGPSLSGDRQGKLNWRRLLRRYVGRILKVRPAFTRPPRRFPEMVGIIPGRCRQQCKPKIMTIIDTSASLTKQLLEDISAELDGLARNFEVLVVECDADIHRVYPFRRPLKHVCGGGGTDFRPPLNGEFLRRYRPDLIIYFTDGGGPAPTSPPRPPVIWCLVPGGQTPAPWGKVVTMQ